jgi:hypothetical protein
MMRFATLSIAGMFLVAVLVMSMWPEGARFGSPNKSVAQDETAVNTVASNSSPDVAPETAALPPRTQMSASTQRDQETERELTQVIDLEFDETPFIEVMESISKRSGLRLLLDHSCRDDMLSEDEPITFQMKGVPLGKVLQLLLGEKNATFMLGDGIIRIIYEDVAGDSKFFRLKTFDCRNILDNLRVLERQRIGTVNAQTDHVTVATEHGANGAAATGLAGAGTMGGNMGAECGSATLAPNAETMLMDLIRKMVNSDDWDQSGGQMTLQIVGGVLVVNGTQDTFGKIDKLLQDLNFQIESKNDPE